MPETNANNPSDESPPESNVPPGPVLTTLYEFESAAAEVEIIAVHGIGGHPLHTWTYIENPLASGTGSNGEPANSTNLTITTTSAGPSTPITATVPPTSITSSTTATTTNTTTNHPPQANETLWLRDLLPRPTKTLSHPGVPPTLLPLLSGNGIKQPLIRVFGYDTRLILPPHISEGGELPPSLEHSFITPLAVSLLQALNRGSSFAERPYPEGWDDWDITAAERVPYVFIGQDLGGTIIKKALAIASQVRGYHNILMRAGGLVLFSVPSHPTSDDAEDGKKVKKLKGSGRDEGKDKADRGGGGEDGGYEDLLLDIAMSVISDQHGGVSRSSRKEILKIIVNPSDVNEAMTKAESVFALINPSIYRTVSIFASPATEPISTITSNLVNNYIAVPHPNAVLGGLTNAGGDGWGGRELEIPRPGHTHSTAPRFSRTNPEDLKVVGAITGLIREICFQWDAIRALRGFGTERELRKASWYRTLRRECTPYPGGLSGGGPGMGVAGLVRELPWKEGGHGEIPMAGMDWVKKHPEYRAWRGHGKSKGTVQKRDVDVAGVEKENIPAGGAVLHIYGREGTGKSFLARWIVQKLLREASKTASSSSVTEGIPSPPPTNSLGVARKNTKDTSPSTPQLTSIDTAITENKPNASPNPRTPSPDVGSILNLDTSITGPTPIIIPRPIILAYTPPQTHHLTTPSAHTNNHTYAHTILLVLISQFLIQHSSIYTAHTLHRLHRAIAKRRKGYRWWTGWSQEDIWLLFDEMLATREGRAVFIVIDHTEGLTQIDEVGKGVRGAEYGTKWVLQRLVDRVASGGPEGGCGVKLVLTTPGKRDIVTLRECAGKGYKYHPLSLNREAIFKETNGKEDANPQAMAWGSYITALMDEKGFPSALEGLIKNHILLNPTSTYLDLQLLLELKSLINPKTHIRLAIERLILPLQPSVDREASIESCKQATNTSRRELFKLHYEYHREWLSQGQFLRSRNKDRPSSNENLILSPTEKLLARQHWAWFNLALGWLLYTPQALKFEELALAIAQSMPPKFYEAHSEGNNAQDIPCSSEETLFKLHPLYDPILTFLKDYLVSTPFVHKISANNEIWAGATPVAKGSPGELNTWLARGGLYVGLRHESVREFLLSLPEKSGNTDTNGQSDTVYGGNFTTPTHFSDAKAWNELLCLTCLKMMNFPWTKDVKFPGEGVEAKFEIETEIEPYNESDYQIPGADEWGEKIPEGEAKDTEKTQGEKGGGRQEVKDMEDKEMGPREDSKERDKSGDEVTKGLENPEQEGKNGEENIVVLNESTKTTEGVTIIDAEVSQDPAADHTAVEEARSSAATAEQHSTIAGAKEFESDDDKPTTPDTSPLIPIRKSHANLLFLAYAIKNWPVHAYKYYRLQSADTCPNTSPSTPTSDPLTKELISFLTAPRERLAWWRDHFIYLSRAATNSSITHYPLSTNLAQSPLELSSQLGLFPLVKVFTHPTDSPILKPQRTLKTKILAMEAAAGYGQLDCFKHLFYMHTHLDYPVTYFLVSLIRAVKNGFVEVLREVLTGPEGDRVKRLMKESKISYWDYPQVMEVAAESGHVDCLRLLMEEIPEGEYVKAGFFSLKKETEKKSEEQNAGESAATETEPVAKQTPLHYACKAGFIQIVKLLLETHDLNNFPQPDPSKADGFGFTPLHHAARKGHLEVVRYLLSHHSDFVDVDTQGWAIKPLHLAAEKRYHLIVEELLRHKASPDFPDQTGRTPLHKACIDGHVKIVQVLLNQAVDASVADEAGVTPLHLAANRGNVDIVDLLIWNGAEPNAKVEKTGQTPLHYAATKGHVNVVRRLLECGAQRDPQTKDTEYTPLHLAAYYEHVEVCKVLVEFGADVNAITKPNPDLFYRSKCWNVLHLTWGNLLCTKLFIDAGCDVNLRDENGDTPLTVAAFATATENLYPLVKMLLDAGAEVHTPSATDPEKPRGVLGNLLYIAVKEGSVDTARLLLDHGMDVNEFNNFGDRWTPLYRAANDHNIELVKLLLDRGADTHLTHMDYAWRPLHVAAFEGQNEIVGLLIAAAADVNCRTMNEEGYTPLYYASNTGHVEVVRTLLENGAKTSLPNEKKPDGEWKYEYTPLYTAASNGYPEIVKVLLEKEVDVEQYAGGEEGLTAFYMAASHGHLECVRLLLEQGKAEINRSTAKAGWTALHAAAVSGHTDVVKYLLSQPGIDIDLQTGDQGYSAIYLACSEGCTENVKLLLEKNADPVGLTRNVAPQLRVTPLQVAAQDGQKAIVELLLAHPAVRETINEFCGPDEDETALSKAVANDHPEIAKLLLETGADPTLRPAPEHPAETNKPTILNSACIDGHEELVDYLLEKYPKVVEEINVVSGKSLYTPVYSACSWGFSSIARKLLACGADPTIVTTTGWTPLHIACAEGHLDCVKLMLEQPNVDINLMTAGTDPGSTPAYLAASNDRIHILEYLISVGGKVTAIPHPDHGWAPLQHAAMAGNMQVAKVLLSCVDVVEAIDYRAGDEFCTALYLAARSGHMELCKLLIEHGANVDLPINNGTTPMSGAAQDGHLDCVQFLIEYGANVEGNISTTRARYKDPHIPDAEEHDAFTPLYNAVSNNHPDIVTFLLENGADPSFTAANGTTPLHVACRDGSIECVKILLSHGADPNAGYLPIPTDGPKGDLIGMTPLYYASLYGKTECAKLILSHGVHPDKAVVGSHGWRPLLVAADGGYAETTKLLLEHGADINAMTKTGGTALYRAAINGYLTICKMLIDAGANVNGNDPRAVPYIAAATGGHAEVMKLLIEYGADPKKKESLLGRDVVFAAAVALDSYILEKLVSEELAKKEVNARDIRGRTPLFYAAAAGRGSAVERFLEYGADVGMRDVLGRGILDVLLTSDKELRNLLGDTNVEKEKKQEGLGQEADKEREEKVTGSNEGAERINACTTYCTTSSYDGDRVCDYCRKDLDCGYFWHCCKCDELFDICPSCYFTDNQSCKDPDEHEKKGEWLFMFVDHEMYSSMAYSASWMAEAKMGPTGKWGVDGGKEGDREIVVKAMEKLNNAIQEHVKISAEKNNEDKNEGQEVNGNDSG